MVNSEDLYKKCDERQKSIDILKGRWRLLGHILRRSDETTAVKAMKFHFEESKKRFRGRPKESIVRTLNKDINRAKSMNRDFLIPTLRRKEDFEHTRSIAQDRKAWKKYSDVVCGAAEAETT